MSAGESPTSQRRGQNRGNGKSKGARPKTSANGADTGGRYEGNRKRGNLEIDGVPWNGKTEATAVFVAWVVRVRTECLRRILRRSAGESPTPQRQRQSNDEGKGATSTRAKAPARCRRCEIKATATTKAKAPRWLARDMIGALAV